MRVLWCFQQTYWTVSQPTNMSFCTENSRAVNCHILQNGQLSETRGKVNDAKLPWDVANNCYVDLFKNEKPKEKKK